MKNKNRYLLVLFTVLYLIFQLTGCNEQQSSDPLPSWNEGKTKQSIIDFVNEVTITKLTKLM